jgi:hypothetical protein
MATNGNSGGAEGGETTADRNVEIWKIKKLIKSLEAARGFVFSQNIPNENQNQIYESRVPS